MIEKGGFTAYDILWLVGVMLPRVVSDLLLYD